MPYCLPEFEISLCLAKETIKVLCIIFIIFFFRFYSFPRKKPIINTVFVEDGDDVFQDFLEGEENYNPTLNYCFDEDTISDIGYELHMSQRYGSLEREGRRHLQESCVPLAFPPFSMPLLSFSTSLRNFVHPSQIALVPFRFQNPVRR